VPNIRRIARSTSCLGCFVSLAGPLLSTVGQVPLYNRVPALVVFFILCFLHMSPTSDGEMIVTTFPSGMDKYDRVLPGARKRSLAALPSPSQCQAALATMPWVDHCPSYTPFTMGKPEVGFWRCSGFLRIQHKT
jgi:hypothetical protein